jgi:hypothetical protein
MQHICSKTPVSSSTKLLTQLGLHFGSAFVVSVLAFVVYGCAMLMQASPVFCGCALVCTYVQKWWCVQLALELGFST